MKFGHRDGRAQREDTPGKGLVTLEGRSEASANQGAVDCRKPPEAGGGEHSPAPASEEPAPARTSVLDFGSPEPRDNKPDVLLYWKADRSALFFSLALITTCHCMYFSCMYPQHPHWHTSLRTPRPCLHHASVTRPGVYLFFRELFIECLLCACARSCCKCWGDSCECIQIKILSSLKFTFY